MTTIAGCVMHADLKCMVRALVFSRRAEVRIGVNATGIGGLDCVVLTVSEARAFRRALSRAIREAEAHVYPKPATPHPPRSSLVEAVPSGAPD